MTDEQTTMVCQNCWNKVERIQYRESGFRTPGEVENVWKHSPYPENPPVCSLNPITDYDVVPETEVR